jgi:hypothetical protein
VFTYLLKFLLFIGCRKADFKMNVDGEVGLESGNSADDHFIHLRPGEGGGGGGGGGRLIVDSKEQRLDSHSR